VVVGHRRDGEQGGGNDDAVSLENRSLIMRSVERTLESAIIDPRIHARERAAVPVHDLLRPVIGVFVVVADLAVAVADLDPSANAQT
jgi:hypothetical protein